MLLLCNRYLYRNGGNVPTYFEYLLLSYIIKILNHTLTCTCHISKLSQCADKNHKKVLDICIKKNE